MKIILAQIKYKTGDFNFNYESIVKTVVESGKWKVKSKKSETTFNFQPSLIIFPQADIEEIGGKDLILDENVRKSQIEFYQKIADENLPQNILIGDILIRNGKVEASDDGFFEIEGKKIFVSDTFIEDIDCDLYVLAKNRYYAMNTYKDFV